VKMVMVKVIITNIIMHMVKGVLIHMVQIVTTIISKNLS